MKKKSLEGEARVGFWKKNLSRAKPEWDSEKKIFRGRSPSGIVAKRGFSRYLQNLNYEQFMRSIFGLSVLWGQKKKKKKKKNTNK